MRLQLNGEQLNTLLAVLEHRVHELESELVHTDARQLKHELAQDLETISALNEKVLDLDLLFSADELETLSTVLRGRADHLQREIARTEHRDYKQLLLAQHAVIQAVCDKVTEACAMV